MIVFSCKDPLIESYCQKTFAPQFAREARNGHPPPSVTDRWNDILFDEAIRQSWYDYTVDDQGQRRLVFDYDHYPRYLIPSWRWQEENQ